MTRSNCTVPPGRAAAARSARSSSAPCSSRCVFPFGIYFVLVVLVHIIGVTPGPSSYFLQHARMFLYKQVLASLDDQLGARSLGHVGFEILFLVQVTMAVHVRARIRLPSYKSAKRYRLSPYGQRPRFSCSIL